MRTRDCGGSLNRFQSIIKPRRTALFPPLTYYCYVMYVENSIIFIVLFPNETRNRTSPITIIIIAVLVSRNFNDPTTRARSANYNRNAKTFSVEKL